jgi:hypothetical protein
LPGGCPGKSWHTERADFTAGLGISAPTGEYEFRDSDNLNLGMWSFELFAGTTTFFDDAKSWHFATTAFYEIDTEKKETDIRVGDILTLEGGLGKSFMEGALNVRVAYYAQWKETEDDLGLGIQLPGGRGLGKHRMYGLGPEVTVPIASKKKLYGFINARYYGSSGHAARLKETLWCLQPPFPFQVCRWRRNKPQPIIYRSKREIRRNRQ